ncbi:hypothetical protein K7432_006498, partial [Basidiobolus ranarum]
YGPYLIPEQNATPWVNAIEELYLDKNTYESHRQEGLVASRQFIHTVDTTCYERWLLQMCDKTVPAPPLASSSKMTTANVSSCIIPSGDASSAGKRKVITKSIKV